MPILNDKSKKNFRRELRNDPTYAEKSLWIALRGNNAGAKFRRQESVGVYVLDFYCPEFRLCVEIDGASHEGREDYDQNRDAEVRRHHVTTLRFTDSQVLNLPEQTLAKIREAIIRMRESGLAVRKSSNQLSFNERARRSTLE